MEAEKNVPKLNLENFYVSKLACYDLSVYDLKTGHMTCYLWDQTQAARGSNKVGSCILHIYIPSGQFQKMLKKVVIWADKCSGQNRNKVNSAAILQYCIFFARKIR